jgi:hypothetical protein
MIELVLESQGNVLGIKVRKSLSGRDYADVLVPHLDWIVQEHGRARLLFSMEGDVRGLEPESPWLPERFGIKHGDQIEKLAVAGESPWAEWCLKIGEVLSECQVSVFAPGKWEEAWDWIIL